MKGILAITKAEQNTMAEALNLAEKICEVAYNGHYEYDDLLEVISTIGEGATEWGDFGITYENADGVGIIYPPTPEPRKCEDEGIRVHTSDGKDMPYTDYLDTDEFEDMMLKMLGLIK